MTTLSKIERWQKKHKINGRPMPAKNMNPPPLGYKGQQWATGSTNSAPVGRKRRFSSAMGPGKTFR